MRKIGTIAIVTLIYLAVFDVIGVIACFIFDVADALPLRGSSTALFYTIWFVLGVFCGLFSYTSSGSAASPEAEGDWTDGDGAVKTGLLVVGITASILVLLSIWFYRIYWRYDMEASFFVPDSGSASIMFFAMVLASVIFAHRALGPQAKKAQRGPK